MPDITVQDVLRWLKENRANEFEILKTKDGEEVALYVPKGRLVLNIKAIDVDELLWAFANDAITKRKMFHTIYFAYHTVEDFLNAL